MPIDTDNKHYKNGHDIGRRSILAALVSMAINDLTDEEVDAWQEQVRDLAHEHAHEFSLWDRDASLRDIGDEDLADLEDWETGLEEGILDTLASIIKDTQIR